MVTSSSKPSRSRVAVVTGGNRGIGLEVCRQLADREIHVVLGTRTLKSGEAAAQTIAGAGRDIQVHTLDVTDAKSVKALTTFVEEKLGGADILVNNAGILLDEDADALDVDIADFRTIMETNAYGALRMCQALAPGMKQRGYGRIVNVSSGASQLSSMTGYAPPYSVSKTALNAITRLVAFSLRNHDILVNAVDPGWVRTDMGGPQARRSVQQGADTITWCATLPKKGPTGQFFHDRQPIAW